MRNWGQFDSYDALSIDYGKAKRIEEEEKMHSSDTRSYMGVKK